MSPIVIPAGFVEVTAHFSTGGGSRPCVSVYGCKGGVAPPAQSEIDQLSLALGNAYKARLNGGGGWQGIRAVFLNGGVLQVLTSVSGAGAGASGSALCPPNVQVLIRKQTLLFGRQGMGRTFIGDVPEANINDNGGLDGTALTNYGNMATAINGAFNAAPFVGMYLLHPNATAPTLVNSFTVEPKVATLRRRFVR